MYVVCKGSKVCSSGLVLTSALIIEYRFVAISSKAGLESGGENIKFINSIDDERIFESLW